MSWSDRIRSPGVPIRPVSVQIAPEALRKLDDLAQRLAVEHGVNVSRGRAIEMLVEGVFDE
jgi:hypothetical protein